MTSIDSKTIPKEVTNNVSETALEKLDLIKNAISSQNYIEVIAQAHQLCELKKSTQKSFPDFAFDEKISGIINGVSTLLSSINLEKKEITEAYTCLQNL